MAASAAKNPPYAAEKWWNQGTTALVTGANKGIGLEIARELARQGVTVVVTARNEELGAQARDLVEKAAEEGGSEACVFFQQLDVTDLNSIDLLSAWVQDYVGGIDILVGQQRCARMVGLHSKHVIYMHPVQASYGRPGVVAWGACGCVAACSPAQSSCHADMRRMRTSQQHGHCTQGP